MTMVISALPIRIRKEIEAKKCREVKATCIVREYVSGFEVLIQGIDQTGSNFCMFKNCSKEEFASFI